jgi:peptidoglycan-associated lipoprotein
VQISELGNVEPTGSAQVTPRSPTTYTATAVGPGGTASDTVRITVNARPAPPAPPEPSRPTVTLDDDFRSNVQDVYFDYDRATIRPDQTTKLEVLLGWLREHPATSIVIEGHCDERGSQEYNLGLGDSRASAARSYLTNAGISRDRLEIISYGEERPMCREENESCWSRNRRAHFVLNAP